MKRKSSKEEPFAALAFKVATDPFLGSLTFCRVYSGTLETGTYVLNATKGKKVRVQSNQRFDWKHTALQGRH